MRRSVGIAGSTLLLLWVTTGVVRVLATAPTYTVEDLGTTTDGYVPSVTGINANGQVSGTAATALGQRPVRFTSGVGFEYLAGVDTTAGVGNAINDIGEVAGYTVTSAGQRAYSTGAGTLTFVAPAAGGTLTFGWGINALGVIAGYANTSAGLRAFRDTPGAPLEVLPTLGGNTLGFGINDNGQVVGASANSTNVQHAFRANPDGTIDDLGSLSTTGGSIATAIDKSGDVVGRAFTPSGVSHAFRYTDHMQDIDTLGTTFSSATAVSGPITVGTFTAANNTSHAFMHTFADGMVDLNTRIPTDSGWVLMSATGVNSNGQIVGMGLLNGVQRAYRLTPDVPKDTTPPVISGISATPASIWPPIGNMVTVTISVSATDDVDPAPACSLTGISGGPSSDESVTGPFTGSVKAVGGRTYTFTASCSDASGNTSASSVDVQVPPDVTAPKITSLSVTPSIIWPPNGSMTPVAISAGAADDVDPAPTCALSGITATEPSTADWTITGPFSATVRAKKNSDGSAKVYSLAVTCADFSGNTRTGIVTVSVTHLTGVANTAVKGKK